jgi:hypothetical protein
VQPRLQVVLQLIFFSDPAWLGSGLESDSLISVPSLNSLPEMLLELIKSGTESVADALCVIGKLYRSILSLPLFWLFHAKEIPEVDYLGGSK